MSITRRSMLTRFVAGLGSVFAVKAVKQHEPKVDAAAFDAWTARLDADLRACRKMGPIDVTHFGSTKRIYVDRLPE